LEPLNGCFLLQQAVVGRRWVYIYTHLLDLREIKKIWVAILMPQANISKTLALWSKPLN
jgi:hypothetical protein